MTDGQETPQFGRYQVKSRLGAGGMGVVLRAYDTVLRRDVAIKLVPPNLRALSTIAERFRREAVTLARLSHPNIVRVFDVGEQGGTLYYVMELLAGQGLDKRTRIPEPGQPTFPPPAFVSDDFFNLFIPLAEALEVVHENGIVHRDIKPANIFAGVPERGAVLTDFGLTLDPGAEKLTQEGMVMGTGHYMAPEQARGEPASAAADLFSLGATMFEFVTGRIPFDGFAGASLLAARTIAELAPVNKIAPEVPAPVAAVVDRCVRPAVEDRFACARDLHRALTRAKRQLESQDGERPVSSSAAIAATRSRLISGRAALPATAALPTQAVQPAGRRGPWLVAGCALLLAVAGVLFWHRDPTGGTPAGPAAARSSVASAGTTTGAVMPAVRARPEPPRPRPGGSIVLTGPGATVRRVGLAAVGNALLAAWPGADGKLSLRLSTDRGWHWSAPPADRTLSLDRISDVALFGRLGRFHLLYVFKTPSRRALVVYSFTSAAADSWAPSTSLGPAAHAGSEVRLTAATDAPDSDKALATWEAPGNPSPMTAFGSLAAGTWMPPSTPEGSHGHDTISGVLRADGSAVLFWQEEDEHEERGIMSSRCAGAGAAWTRPRRVVADPPGFSRLYPAALATGGKLFLQYGENQIPSHPLVLGASSDDGQTLERVAYVYHPFCKDSRATVAGVGRRLFSSFRLTMPSLQCWSVSNDGGRSWSRDRALGPVDDEDPAAPTLLVLPDGEAWCAWTDDRRRVVVTRLS